MKANRYLLAMALVLTGTVAMAQENGGGPENDPEHGVARISVLAGDVSIQRGDSGEQSAAAVNAPLVTGDVVTTAPGAHAEIQFDSANMVRLASDSEVRLSEVARGRYQLQVARGTVMFSVTESPWLTTNGAGETSNSNCFAVMLNVFADRGVGMASTVTGETAS